MNKSVMDLVTFYEQAQNKIAQSNGQMDQPQMIRPGSADKVFSLDGSFEEAAMAQFQAQNHYHQITRIPATPHSQARYGNPITPQSIRRSGAPNTLMIPNHIPSLPAQQSAYAPTAGLSTNSPTFAHFPPTSADRASFPDLDSPLQQNSFQLAPGKRGHARNHSVVSIASSIGSAGSLFFPDSSSQFPATSTHYARHPGTPPSSPKKRKSPTKSPSKGKDRPNYLDKAIMKNTGVTQEQINALIGEPLESDLKNWRCLADGCSHLAARKENIRAHVQTHLGDRPYECPECHADFVRSHDFTRHYTTHVDSRDFKCPDCPQAFNRADALQRHRDRDFCNGPPPSSPTKVRRAIDAIDKKKDLAGRRSKKQATRRKTTRRPESPDLSDDFWSSSAGSPQYLSSDAGSPEMILDSIVEDFPRHSSAQQTYVPMEQVTFSTSDKQRDDAALERIFAALSEANSTPNHSQSLSPPMSPQQSHHNLPPFSPTPRQSRHKEHEMTPPASRDSMLEFLSTASVHDAQTVNSAPSLPDLSSTSTSPLAFEPVADFDEFCNGLSDSGDSWLDQRFTKSHAETSFDFGQLLDTKAPHSTWMDTSEDLFGSL